MNRRLNLPAVVPPLLTGVMADLDSLTETGVERDGERLRLRSASRHGAGLALSALGVALPPTLRRVSDA